MSAPRSWLFAPGDTPAKMEKAFSVARGEKGIDVDSY